jgi:hypothetical protein
VAGNSVHHLARVLPWCSSLVVAMEQRAWEGKERERRGERRHREEEKERENVRESVSLLTVPFWM